MKVTRAEASFTTPRRIRKGTSKLRNDNYDDEQGATTTAVPLSVSVMPDVADHETPVQQFEEQVMQKLSNSSASWMPKLTQLMGPEILSAVRDSLVEDFSNGDIMSTIRNFIFPDDYNNYENDFQD